MALPSLLFPAALNSALGVSPPSGQDAPPDAAAGKPMMSVGEEREILSPEVTQIGRVRTRGSAIGAMNCDGNLARLRPGFLRRTTGSQVQG